MESGTNTRDRMIEAAIVLMRRTGVSGAGINEIVKESGAPKGSMYHFFPGGKREILATSLEIYAGRIVAFLDDTLARGKTPEAKVKALLKAFARRVEGFDFRQSCAAGCVSLDLDEDSEVIRQAAKAAFDAYVAAIERHFDFGSPRATRSFASLLLTAIEGAYIRARAERSSQAFVEAAEWLAPLAKRGL
jgi:TetR/AcrR family transcriptional regulator, lmrAB and yxaGH operons repressor